MPAPQIMRPVICCRWRRQRQQTHPQSCKCRVCSDPWEERQPGPLCHKLPDHMQWACRRAFLAPTRTHQPTALWLVLPPPQIKDELWSFNAQCCLCRSTRSANSTGHNRQRLRRKPQEKAVRQQEQDTERTQCFVSRAVHHYLSTNFLIQRKHTNTPTTANKDIPPADPHSRSLHKLSIFSNALLRSCELRPCENVDWRPHQEATSLDISQVVGESATRPTTRMCDKSTMEPATATRLKVVDHATRSSISGGKNNFRPGRTTPTEQNTGRGHAHACTCRTCESNVAGNTTSERRQRSRTATQNSLQPRALHPNTGLRVRKMRAQLAHSCAWTHPRNVKRRGDEPLVCKAYCNRAVPECKGHMQTRIAHTLTACLHAGGERDLVPRRTTSASALSSRRSLIQRSTAGTTSAPPNHPEG